MACSINALLTKRELKKAGYSAQNASSFFCVCLFGPRRSQGQLKEPKLKKELLATAGPSREIPQLPGSQSEHRIRFTIQPCNNGLLVTFKNTEKPVIIVTQHESLTYDIRISCYQTRTIVITANLKGLHYHANTPGLQSARGHLFILALMIFNH